MAPQCTRCRNHGESCVPLKGHKKACKFRDCSCSRCILVVERSRLSREFRKLVSGKNATSSTKRQPFESEEQNIKKLMATEASQHGTNTPPEKTVGVVLPSKATSDLHYSTPRHLATPLQRLCAMFPHHTVAQISEILGSCGGSCQRASANIIACLFLKRYIDNVVGSNVANPQMASFYVYQPSFPFPRQVYNDEPTSSGVASSSKYPDFSSEAAQTLDHSF